MAHLFSLGNVINYWVNMASYWFNVDYFLIWKMESCHNAIWAQQTGCGGGAVLGNKWNKDIGIAVDWGCLSPGERG